MSKKPKQKKVSKKASRKVNPLRTVLEELVVPVFEEAADKKAEESIKIVDDDGDLVLQGILDSSQIVFVRAHAIDRERTILRMNLLAGLFVADIGMQALLLGSLLDQSFFHVQTGMILGHDGQMLIGCDLVVRRDDEPLVRQRVGELLTLGNALDWFFPLRMPHRLRWTDLAVMEFEWEELPHNELDEFVEDAMAAPPGERTPYTLILIAQGLGRWRDVLRLLREHPEEFPADRMAPLKALACRELGRWLPAIEAAEEEGGLENGRYAEAKWLSPSYMHSLIEAGKDIEALSLLGQPEDDEPGFYDWLRGLALHHAGDNDGADKAFIRYFARWPGDAIGGAFTQSLMGE